jgi:hypothetical protein
MVVLFTSVKSEALEKENKPKRQIKQSHFCDIIVKSLSLRVKVEKA